MRAAPLRILLGFGLFFLGLPTWLCLAPPLQMLSPWADWPKTVAMLTGLLLPLMFAACFEYDRGRTRKIGYLVLGWLLGGLASGGAAYCVLLLARLAPHG